MMKLTETVNLILAAPTTDAITDITEEFLADQWELLYESHRDAIAIPGDAEIHEQFEETCALERKALRAIVAVRVRMLADAAEEAEQFLTDLDDDIPF